MPGSSLTVTLCYYNAFQVIFIFIALGYIVVVVIGTGVSYGPFIFALLLVALILCLVPGAG